MQKCWEFEQKNIFSELLSLLGRMTQENLTYQIQYLKVENEILRKRIGKCIRPTAIEKRKLLKFGAPLGKDIRNIISIVTYETFLLWIRRYKRKKDSEKTKKRGRPKTLEEIRKLIVRLAKENAWGYVRILGELKKFFVLFFINIKTRRVYAAGATRYPNQEWVNKQTRNILPFLGSNKSSKKLLIRDRDTKFSREFDELFKNDGFAVQRLPFMSPNMNSYAESWVGTIKRECLNYFIIFGERHLRYLISEYVKHYNETRPHSSMGNRPLGSRLTKDTGEIECRSKLGGIIRDYYRA